MSSEANFLENWGEPLSGEGYRVVCVKTRKTAIQCAEMISSANNENINVIWDAESWLSNIPFIKFPCRILFLRYATDKSNLLLFFKSKVKQLLINYIGRINRNLMVRYLTSPFLKRSEKSNLGVSDDLISVLLEGYSRSNKSQNSESKIVKLLIPGFITWRKRPDLIVNFVKTNLRHVIDSNYIFIFSGSMDKRSLDFLHENSCTNIHTLNHYLSYSDYIQMILDSSVVLLPYDDLGSSNVLTEAVHLGIPVVIKESIYWEKLDPTLTKYIYKSDFSPDDLRVVLNNILSANEGIAKRGHEIHSCLSKNELLGFFSGYELR